jgi:hypothetical protein
VLSPPGGAAIEEEFQNVDMVGAAVSRQTDMGLTDVGFMDMGFTDTGFVRPQYLVEVPPPG